MLTDAQIIAKYGQPGDEKNFALINLPYPLRYVVAPGKFTVVNKMRCHKLLADAFTNVFTQLLSHYGLPELQRLGIDFFGGCVAVRLQRGSRTKWSRHSWGIAIDLDPLRNGLKTKWPQSQFSKPEYQKLHEIFEANGFLNYGKVRGDDAMHFEISI